MSRVCEITGKRPIVGNNVSHSKRRTKRRFKPNLQNHRIWLENEKRFIRMRITSNALRIIDKKGIEAVLAEIGSRI